MGDTLWQFELDDTSPSISYSPFPDTFSSPNLAEGWNPYYDLSGFAPSPGAIGNGTSSHITSKDGASFTIQWRGTGIELYGNTTQASFSVTLNSAALDVANPSSDPPSTSAKGSRLLADVNGLPDGYHTLTFTAIISSEQIPLNASMIVFDKAVLRTSIPSPSTNITYKAQNIDSTSITFSGQWASENGNSTAPYRVSHTAGDRVSTRFNGTSFALQGSTSSDGANFSVILDGVKTSLSARSSFNVENTTLFFAHGLNSSTEHSIDLSNDSGGKLALQADGFSTIVPSAPQPLPSPAAATPNNSSFSKGAVAAFTLAGVLAFLLLTSAFLYFCVYRRRRRKSGAPPVIYTFSHPSSKGSRESRRQRWLQGLIPRTPKQQEAGDKGYDDVLDIGTGAMESKEDLGDIDEVTRESAVVHEKQGSRGKGDRSGFAKWRREAVDGSIRGIGLPILFRHSDAKTSAGGARTDEPETSPQDTFESGRRYSHVRGTSDESSDSSSERRYIAMANLRNKGKARQITGAGSSPDMSQHAPTTKRSWSPSFRLTLPIPSPSKPSTSKFKWNIPGTSKQRSQEPSDASTQSAGLPPSPNAHQGHLSMQSGGDQVSSFIAASDPSPVATRKRIVDSLQPVRPPSYNDSQQHSSSSSNVLSIPRSVSHSGSGSPVQLTYPRSPLHQHQDSRNVLLREGDAPEDDSLEVSSNVKSLTHATSTSTSHPIHDNQQLPESTQPPPLTLAIPIHDRQQESSGSPDDSSPRAPPSLGQAIRGLSPWTSERGATSASGTSLGLALPYPSARQSVQTQASTVLSTTSTSDGSGSPVEFARNVSPSGVPLAAMHSTTSLVTHTAEDSQEATEEHYLTEPVQLDLRAMSPFQVDFDWRSVRTRTNVSHSSADETPAIYQTAPSRHSRASQSSSDVIPPLPGGPSFLQGSSRVPFRLTTSTMATAPPGVPSISSDLVTSFLDITSSREGSVRTKSLRTVASNENIFGDGSVPPLPGMLSQEPRSRWSNTTVPSFNTRRFTGVTKESSGDSEGEHSSGSNTFPIPVSMTLPPSPHHIMDFPEGSEPPRPSNQTSRTGISSGPPPHTHPILDLESPTDSVPRTVSDFHFRQSDSEDMPGSLLRPSSAPFHNRFLRPLPESPDEEKFSRPPLPQISMVPPSQPQTPAESPSVTRPRPLPTPPVARLNVPENPNLRTQLDP